MRIKHLGCFFLLAWTLAACAPAVQSSPKAEPTAGSTPTVTTATASPTGGEATSTALPSPSSTTPPQATTAVVPDPGDLNAKDPPIGQPRLEDLNRFTAELSAALAARNAGSLRGMLSDTFVLAEWQGQRQTLAPREALQALQAGPLAEGSHPAAFLGQDVLALLGGVDPLALINPQGNNWRAFALGGLGADGAGQGVALIAMEGAKGKLVWKGLLLASGGFPRPTQALITASFQAARAKTDLDLREGPSLGSNMLGQAPAGTILQVLGLSPDGAWVQVRCDKEISGRCWVSADPAGLQEIQ